MKHTFKAFVLTIAFACVPIFGHSQDLLKELDESPVVLPLEQGKFVFTVTDTATVDKKDKIAQFALRMEGGELSSVYVDRKHHIVHGHIKTKPEEKFFKEVSGAVSSYTDQYVYDVQIRNLKDKFVVTFSKAFNLLSFDISEQKNGGGKRVFLSSDQDLAIYQQDGISPMMLGLEMDSPFPFERQVLMMKTTLHFAQVRMKSLLNERRYDSFKSLGF